MLWWKSSALLDTVVPPCGGSLVGAVLTVAGGAGSEHTGHKDPSGPNRSEVAPRTPPPLCSTRLEHRWRVVLPDQLPAARQPRERSAALSFQGQLKRSRFELLHIVIARCDIKDSLTSCHMCTSGTLWGGCCYSTFQRIFFYCSFQTAIMAMASNKQLRMLSCGG